MVSKIFITFGVLIYGVVIPFLEINASHVFNETWPAHARLHEVWQLTTNISIGIVALWLTWVKNQVNLPSILNIAVMGGVLIAHVFEGLYGGSIISGNVEKTVLGIELAAFAAGLVVFLAFIVLVLNNSQLKPWSRTT